MFKKVDFNSILEKCKKDEFNDLLNSDEEIFGIFKEGFYLIKEDSSISKPKFYNKLKILLKIEKKID